MHFVCTKSRKIINLKVGWKTPADCVEALIGVCLLCGGESGPQAVLHWLGLPVLPGYKTEDNLLEGRSVGLEEGVSEALRASERGDWALGKDKKLSKIIKEIPVGAFMKEQYLGKLEILN